MVRFTSKAPPDLIDFVKERLKEGGVLEVTREECGDDGVILGLTTSQRELEEQAESVKLVKPITSPMTGFGEEEGILENFTVATREDFVGYPDCAFFDDKKNNSDEYDSIGLFTASDQVMLIWDMLGSMKVLDSNMISSNLSRKLRDLKCVGIHYHQILRKSTSSEEDSSHALQKKCLFLLLRENGFVDLISPVHVKSIRLTLLKNALKRLVGPPIRPLKDYYGDEVAFYFAWMEHFTRWLIFPGVVGLIIYILKIRSGETVDTCRFIPFHGLITFIWGIFFLRYWERQETRLAFDWGNFSSLGTSKTVFNARPNFYGELRVSPVTGALEKHYPTYKRYLKYFVSALITMMLLAVAFLVMILSLNLQGYVRPRDDRERWQSDHEHPFYYPFFAHLAEDGNLFDAASYWRCYIPVLLHVAVVMSMNMCYRHIAEALTEWENHQTEVEHENSLILKRFLFEAFDAYIILFYLAFFEKDVSKLRSELVSLFNVDTFRRLFVEYILPMILQGGSRKKEKKDYGRRKKLDLTNEDDDDNTLYKSLKSQSTKDPYEEFDDYLEMIIQLGYVTLFASAYPLAPFVAIFANLVEVRTDMMKLTKVCLRPRSIRTDNIGTWKMLMSVIIWGSALTNCLIFGFSSKQLYQWLGDEFYYIDGYETLRMIEGKGWIIIFLIFGIERILVFLALFINQVISTVPPDVKIKEERRQFIRTQLTQRVRVTEIRNKSSLKATSAVISALMRTRKTTDTE